MKIDKQKLEEYTSRIYPTPCPLCHEESQGHMPGDVFQAIEMTKGRPNLSKLKKALPLTPLFCKNCGFTHFINPIVADLIAMEDISSSSDYEEHEE